MNSKTYPRFGLIMLVLTGAVLTLTQCKSNTGTNPTPPPPLELLYPKGGQSFKVGDTVLIKWSVHQPQNIPSVGVSYSLDGGKTFPTYQVLGTGSVAYPDSTLRWIVGQEDVSSQFILVIWEYESQCLSGSLSCPSPYHDKSSSFVVHE